MNKKEELQEIKIAYKFLRTGLKSDYDRSEWTIKKWKPKINIKWCQEKQRQMFEAERPELYYIEKPHLGFLRYYVCPAGMIQPEEIKNGFGLYWYSGTRFFQKKRSEHFRRNLFEENAILCHAIRKLKIEESQQIIIKDLKGDINNQKQNQKRSQKNETRNFLCEDNGK